MDRRESINASVYQDIAGILNAKTYSQLIAMQKQINQKIKSGDAVDIGNYRLCKLSSYLYTVYIITVCCTL